MTPSLEILKETIKQLINKGDTYSLKRLLEKVLKGDIVYVFKYLSPQERIKAFKVLLSVDLEKASDVLYDLDEDVQIEILRNLPSEDTVKVLLTFSPGEIAKIIDKLPKSVQQQLLSKLEEEKRAELEKYISYGEETIAHLINEDFIAIEDNKTVKDALELIKEFKDKDIEIIYIYAIDEKGRLTGVVSLKELLTVSENTQIKDIMTRNVISVYVNSPLDELIEIFKSYDIYVVPVIDEEDKLIGVIYIDEIIDALSEKTTEEFFKMAGAHEEELFYENKILKIAKLRAPWLIVTTVGELFTAFIISLFKITIYKALPIVFFLPLVAAVSGNISSQSAIITARGLITGKIGENLKDIFIYIVREIKISIVLGLFLSFIVGFISFLWLTNHTVGIIVAVALFINILFASFLGGLIPVILKYMKKDPSFATGPIVLTINDILGIFIYLSIASYFIAKLV